MSYTVLQCPLCSKFAQFDDHNCQPFCDGCLYRAKLKNAEDEIEWLKAALKTGKTEESL